MDASVKSEKEILKETKIVPPYVMSIDIDENKSEKLEIFLDSNPEKLSYEFCKTHNLDFDTMRFLTEEIKNLLENGIHSRKKNRIKTIQEVDEEMGSEKPLEIDKSNHEIEIVENKNESYNDNEMNKNQESLENLKINDEIAKKTKDKSKKNGTSLIYKSSICEKLEKKAKLKTNNCDSTNVTTHKFNNKNESLLKNRSNSSEIINFGERLYYKGIKLREESAKRKDKLKNEIIQIENKNNTFKPSLIETTHDFNLMKKKKQLDEANEKKILYYKQYLEEKTNKLKEKYKKIEIFPFSPKINKKFKENNLTKSANEMNPYEKYHKLYDKSKQKALNIKKIEDSIYNYNFRPVLNDNNHIESNFFDRQNMFLKRHNEKLDQLTEENIIDKKTGQRYFSPKLEVNRSCSYLRNHNIEEEGQKSIGEHLYNDAKKFEGRKELFKQEIDQKLVQNSNKIHTLVRTDSIYIKMKKEAFERIYNSFGSADEKSINYFQIIKSNLPSNILKIIDPIIENLKLSSVSIEKKDFFEIMESFFETLTNNDKHLIINFKRPEKKKNFKSEFTFHPNLILRPNSSKTMKKDKKSSSSTSISIFNSTKYQKFSNYQSFSNQYNIEEQFASNIN